MKVSFTDDNGNEETLTSAATAEVEQATAQHSSGNSEATGSPRISGTAKVGQTLTADTSGIGDTDGLTSVSYRYQWVRNDGTTDADIQNATGASYTLVDADEGNTIKVKVSFEDDDGNDETLTSAATTAVIAANTSATGAPTISGTVQVDQTLTADTSGIGDADGLTNVSYSYYYSWPDTVEGFIEQAMADFAKATDLDPSNANAYIGRGDAYYRWKQLDRARQDYDTAIQLLSEAIHLDPKDTESYIARAKAYRFRRDPDKAIQDLDAAISLDPGNPEIYYDRASAYVQKGEDDKSIEDYDMVILLDPNHVHAYNIRGYMHYLADEHDKAIADYDKVIRLNPNFRWAYGNRGDIYNTNLGLSSQWGESELKTSWRPWCASLLT